VLPPADQLFSRSTGVLHRCAKAATTGASSCLSEHTRQSSEMLSEVRVAPPGMFVGECTKSPEFAQLSRQRPLQASSSSRRGLVRSKRFVPKVSGVAVPPCCCISGCHSSLRSLHSKHASICSWSHQADSPFIGFFPSIQASSMLQPPHEPHYERNRFITHRLAAWHIIWKTRAVYTINDNITCLGMNVVNKPSSNRTEGKRGTSTS
jgi:hypothetical protein